MCHREEILEVKVLQCIFQRAAGAQRFLADHLLGVYTVPKTSETLNLCNVSIIKGIRVKLVLYQELKRICV